MGSKLIKMLSYTGKENTSVGLHIILPFPGLFLFLEAMVICVKNSTEVILSFLYSEFFSDCLYVCLVYKICGLSHIKSYLRSAKKDFIYNDRFYSHYCNISFSEFSCILLSLLF